MDDYATGLSSDLSTGQTSPLALEPADVLHYRFAEGGFVMVRPSGTEPKLKIYFSCRGATAAKRRRSSGLCEQMHCCR